MSHILLITLYDQGALGARHLSSVLKARGHRVSLVYFKRYRTLPKSRIKESSGEMIHEGIDLAGRDVIMGISSPVTSRERELLCDLVEELRPDLIGVSARSVTMSTAESITSDLKGRTGGRAPIVWGGIGPTLEPERSLRSCDFVCLGEGELPIVELVDALAKGSGWEGIANLWGNARAGVGAFQNPLRPLIRELDSLPPADMSPEGKFTIDADAIVRNDAAISNFDLLYEIASSRGCPFSCYYCCNSSIHRLYPGQPRVRRRSPEHVVAELAAALKSCRFERINFQDDVFSFDADWVRRFSELYRRDIRRPFWCYIHPEGLKDETLQDLRKAGLDRATLGIQSGSRRILDDVYGRKQKPDAIMKTARRMLDLGIDVNVDIITNNPLETDDDCRATLQMLIDLPRGVRLNSGLSKLSIFPSTRLHEILEESPRPSEPLTPHEAYNILYLVSRGRLVPGSVLIAISRKGWLMRRPGLIRPLLWPVRLREASRVAGRGLLRGAKSAAPAWAWGMMRNARKRLSGG